MWIRVIKAYCGPSVSWNLSYCAKTIFDRVPILFRGFNAAWKAATNSNNRKRSVLIFRREIRRFNTYTHHAHPNANSMRYYTAPPRLIALTYFCVELSHKISQKIRFNSETVPDLTQIVD